MKRWRAFVWGTLQLGAFGSACSVYDPSLLSGVDGADTGGGPSGGSAASGGQAGVGGGSAATSGGSTSTGGAVSCDWGTTSAAGGGVSVLDDFDDNDKWVIEHDGRSGRWNTDSDQSGGTQSPTGLGWESLPMSERADAPGNLALHYVGTNFTSWHLVLAELAAGAPLDLSEYAGLRLWVRGDCAPASTSIVQLRVAIGDALSGESLGAIDHAGFAVPFALTPEWRLVEVPFSALTRRFGSSASFDATTARSFVVSPNAPGDLDVWLDDVAFYTP